MGRLPALLLPAAGRQLSIPFESRRLRGISALDRRVALARLTLLLLEAAGVAVEERDDDER
jgi:hypothetical protein